MKQFFAALVVCNAASFATGAYFTHLTETRNRVDGTTSTSASPPEAPIPTLPKPNSPACEASDDERFNINFRTTWMIRQALSVGLLKDESLLTRYKAGELTPKEVDEVLAENCNPADFRLALSDCLTVKPPSKGDELVEMGREFGWTKGQYWNNYSYFRHFTSDTNYPTKPTQVCLGNYGRVIHFTCANRLIQQQEGMRLASLGEGMSYLHQKGTLPSATFLGASWAGKMDELHTLYFGGEGGPWTLVDGDGLIGGGSAFAVVKSK